MTAQHFPACENILASPVPNAQQLDVLLGRFGLHMILIEGAVCGWMTRYCDEFRSQGTGRWDYFELSNGGFFMAPADIGSTTLSNAMTYSKHAMSADAAGITCCLMAYHHIAHHFAGLNNERACELFQGHREKLEDYAGQHREFTAIYSLAFD